MARLLTTIAVVLLATAVIATAAPVASADSPYTVVQHWSAGAIYQTRDACEEKRFLIGGLDRIVIDGAPREDSYVGVDLSVFDWCLPQPDFVFFLQPAAPSDSGAGWRIPDDALVFGPGHQRATLRWTFDANVYTPETGWQVLAATIDVSWSVKSPATPGAVADGFYYADASGAVSWPGGSISVDSTFTAAIQVLHFQETN